MINFQKVVEWWCLACHGRERTYNKKERILRFVEESIELAQALDLSKEEVIRLVEWVYSRNKGETFQEIGGVMITIAALCTANDYDLGNAGETELTRIWICMDKIREKQLQKISARIGE